MRPRTPKTGGNAAEGDVIRLDYKKIAPGRTGDYFQLKQDYLRLRDAQVEAGKMSGWSAGGVSYAQEILIVLNIPSMSAAT